MHDSEPSGGHPKRRTEYHEGDDAARNFGVAMKQVLTVSKARILELEKQEAKQRQRGK